MRTNSPGPLISPSIKNNAGNVHIFIMLMARRRSVTITGQTSVPRLKVFNENSSKSSCADVMYVDTIK